MQKLEVDKHIEGLTGAGKEWVSAFVAYMRTEYPQLEEVMSFQMPTYKLGSGKNRNYIAFSLGKQHFSMHTMDFDYVGQLKPRLKKPGKGKGCVQVAFDDEAGREALLAAIPDLVKRAGE